MYEHVRATNETAVLFFVSLVIFGNWILLNLFLATLLNNFSEEGNPYEEDADGEDNTFFTRFKRSISLMFKRE